MSTVADRQVVGLFVCPSDHRHGEVGTCYVLHKCRCEGCRSGNAAREGRRTTLKAYGRYVLPWVPAGPVRDHVEFLRSHGMGYKAIARRAGIGPTGVRTLIYGREDYLSGGGTGPRHGEVLQHVGREKAQRILAVQPTLENLPAVAHVPARATVRRLQALIAHGWSMTRLGRELGWGASCSQILRRYEAARQGSLVRASTVLAVIELYDRLSVRVPPMETRWQRAAVTRVRKYAAARGWPNPWDWEAVDNDFERHTPPDCSGAWVRRG